MDGVPTTSGSSRVCRSCGKRWPGDLVICPEDGTALAAADLAPGTMVGEYRIEGKLGEGGMASVFAAVHPIIGKKAAIKVIRPTLCADPEAVERFVEEARAVNRIGHPNIVDIFSLGVLPDGRPYLVMEWLQGESLADRLDRGRMPVTEIIDALGELCLALDTVHGEGIIHRDLKPDNVFLVSIRGGRQITKLIDFGIAKSAFKDDRLQRTRTGIALGTPHYVSPEQARGKNVDHRADIYSLGVMAFEALLGRRPFEGDSAMDIVMQHVTAVPPLPSSIWPGIPPALEALVLRMLDKDPENRPSLLEVAAALSELRASLPASDPASGASGRIGSSADCVSGDGRRPASVSAVQSGSLPPSNETSGTTERRLNSTGPDAAGARARRQSLANAIALGSLWVVAVVALLFVVVNRGGTRAPSSTTTSVRSAPVEAHESTEVAAPGDAVIGATHEPSGSATVGIGSALFVPAALILRIPVRTARVVVDGRAVPGARDGTRVPVESPGDHEVVVTAPGYRPFRRTIAVAAGASVDVTVTLVPTRRRPSVPNPASQKRPSGNYTLDPFAKESRR